MKVRVGDRYIDRPLHELAWEALAAPVLWFLFRQAMHGRWSR